MSGAKSGNKGKGAERELCKILGEIFGGSFIRADSSGAYIGGKNAFRKGHLSESQKRAKKSDIVPPDHLPKLVIESKFYSDFRFHQLLQPGPVPQLDTWIGQCLDAVEPGDFWVVCFKINLRGWSVAVSQDFAASLQFNNHCLYTGKHGSFVVTDMKDFFHLNKDAVERLAA